MKPATKHTTMMDMIVLEEICDEVTLGWTLHAERPWRRRLRAALGNMVMLSLVHLWGEDSCWSRG